MKGAITVYGHKTIKTHGTDNDRSSNIKDN